MILLVFSDNHRDTLSVDTLLARHPEAERRISLGDSELPESALTAREVFGVRGNYPFEPAFPSELIFEWEGHRTLITHGHLFYVKTGLYNLYCHARESACQLVLFGHTHQWMIEQEEGIVFVNPGSSAYPKSGGEPTYASIHLMPDRIRVDIRRVVDGRPVRQAEFPMGSVRRD
jgi:hypothetical protein